MGCNSIGLSPRKGNLLQGEERKDWKEQRLVRKENDFSSSIRERTDWELQFY